jgi:hypothetical protein
VFLAGKDNTGTACFAFIRAYVIKISEEYFGLVKGEVFWIRLEVLNRFSFCPLGFTSVIESIDESLVFATIYSCKSGQAKSP